MSPSKPPATAAAATNHRFNSNTAQSDIKCANQNHGSLEAVPRTHSSNKRLRKDEPLVPPEIEPANKTQRLNGETVVVSDINDNSSSQVPSPTLNEGNPELVEPSSNDPVVAVDSGNAVKKRGRKKGSKSIKKQMSGEDSIKEKLASISRNRKCPTTQELIASIQAKNANLLPSHSVNPPNIEDVLRTNIGNDGEAAAAAACKYLSSNNQNNFSHKAAAAAAPAKRAQQKRAKLKDNARDLAKKYLESEVAPDEDTLDSVPIPTDNSSLKLPAARDLTVEEILAKLPPLDPSSIDWGDEEKHCEDNEEEDELNKSSGRAQEVTEENLMRLHTECIEGLNGNFQPKLSAADTLDIKSETIKTCENEVTVGSVIGLRRPSTSHKDEVFREWHEMLARPSIDGQILHILPYVIID